MPGKCLCLQLTARACQERQLVLPLQVKGKGCQPATLKSKIELRSTGAAPLGFLEPVAAGQALRVSLQLQKKKKEAFVWLALAMSVRVLRRFLSLPPHIAVSGANIVPASVSAADAVKAIQSNSTIFVHTAGATPTILLEALASRLDRDASLRSLNLCHLHLEGPMPLLRHADRVRSNSFFIGGNMREAVNRKEADCTSIFLSEIPLLFRRQRLPLDVAFVTVSPFDRHGFASLGISVDVALAAVEAAKHVIAVVNPNMPRTHGRGLIHCSSIDAVVEDRSPIYERRSEEKPTRISADSSTTVEEHIGKLVAERIPDGACLQMGIGNIPDAVLSCLRNHKNLGIHSEMISSGILPLIEGGVINNSKKAVMPGKIVFSFALGNRALYDFLDDNPMIHADESSWVNDPSLIRQNNHQVSINSCIEIDLTGQVVSDSIGMRIYSGVGGQVDFLRGAALSVGGLPVLALPSVTSKGESRIVPTIRHGAGVVTTRAHVHHVATEHGMVDLFGKSLRERAYLLTSIAHPNHREALAKEAFDRFGREVWPAAAV